MQEDRINELTPLQGSLRYKFKDLALLNKALTHKSYSNETLLSVKNNERLEFLGDSVLDLIVGDYMFLTYQDLPEGSLSKIRAAVVNESCLAGLAHDIKLGSYLLLGKGECFSGGRQKASILANTYEAIVGALFCDSDFQTTADVFLPQLVEKIDACRMRACLQILKAICKNIHKTSFLVPHRMKSWEKRVPVMTNDLRLRLPSAVKFWVREKDVVKRKLNRMRQRRL